MFKVKVTSKDQQGQENNWGEEPESYIGAEGYGFHDGDEWLNQNGVLLDLYKEPGFKFYTKAIQNAGHRKTKRSKKSRKNRKNRKSTRRAQY